LNTSFLLAPFWLKANIRNMMIYSLKLHTLAVKFNLLKDTQPHYIYKPESCLENDNYKLYFDRTVLTDIHIKHNRPDIFILNKQQKQAYLLDIAVPNSHNITQTYNTKINNSILSIKNGNDNVRIEDNCLEEELATTPILSEICTLSLTFVMLMRFFARLNIYYKIFLTRMQCDTTPFTSYCHNVDFCIAFLRQSANNYRHCSFCAQISPVVLKNKQ
jgi:hypothetical protein